MKVKLLAIIVGILLIPLVYADTTINQTIISDGDIHSEQNLYANNVDLTINGVDIDAYDSFKYNSITTYIEDNQYSWARDSSGISRYTLANIMERAMSMVKEMSFSSNDIYGRIAFSLYEIFVPRSELSELYSNINFRLKTIEDYLSTHDPEGFCKSALNVANDEGYKKISCLNVTYTLTNDEAIVIEEVK